MKYEGNFYSSSAIEEEWKPKDLGENFAALILPISNLLRLPEVFRCLATPFPELD